MKENIRKFTRHLVATPKKLITLTMLLAFMAGPAFSDVRLEPLPKVEGLSQSNRQLLSIEGSIGGSDFYGVLMSLPESSGVIRLNSSGGNVEEAMKIGRLLRNENVEVIIDRDGICASACVLILAGAPVRFISGKVMIHRPYLPNDTTSDAGKQKARYEALGVLIKEYLQEMNVSPSLYDDMVRVSSANIRALSKDELFHYGLTVQDPYADEAQLSESANDLRISKEDYIARRHKVEEVCAPLLGKSPDEYGKCATAITYGISRAEYDRRDAIANTKCGKSGSAEWARCHTEITRGF